MTNYFVAVLIRGVIHEVQVAAASRAEAVQIANNLVATRYFPRRIER